MSHHPENVGRRHPVHWDPLEKGNRSSILFFTVCSKDRQPLLANPECHKLLVDWWTKGDHWLAGKDVGLVEDPEKKWPYRGEIHILDWHDP